MMGPVEAAVTAEMDRVGRNPDPRLTEHGKALAAIMAMQVVLAQALDKIGNETVPGWDGVKLG